MKAAQKLLDALTIGGGSARAGDGVGGSYKRHISLQPAENHKNGTENRRFPARFGLKLPKTPFFAQKYLVLVGM